MPPNHSNYLLGTRESMEILNTAFEKNYFYFTACVVGVLFGFGGLVHLGNIFGFGEVTCTESPIQI